MRRCGFFHAKCLAVKSIGSAFKWEIPSFSLRWQSSFCSFGTTERERLLRARQKGILFEGLPLSLQSPEAFQTLLTAEVNSVLGFKRNFPPQLPDVQKADVLTMKSALGRNMNRTLVLWHQTLPDSLKRKLPRHTTITTMDTRDVEGFVEQCERYIRFTEDLRRLGCADHFGKVVTLTDLPVDVVREDVARLSMTHAGVKVVNVWNTSSPADVLF
eukprot:GHVN01034323.1.p1 GENE.GHVN01034323.1~~GHVN01034323.1.p1  ORF type:complete len:215 (+),score=17.43 GHVN01034323.1:44-688(+)